ncbi:hypothetical protein QF031_000684 [Pseudarthrobacter defluvii]|nr:hypothetical protein [Pseudarthrobacter defluvii]
MIDESLPNEPLPSGGGTLVIRTWIEPDDDPGFRARITYSQGAGQQGSLITVDPEEVLHAVRQWLSTQNG